MILNSNWFHQLHSFKIYMISWHTYIICNMKIEFLYLLKTCSMNITRFCCCFSILINVLIGIENWTMNLEIHKWIYVHIYVVNGRKTSRRDYKQKSWFICDCCYWHVLYYMIEFWNVATKKVLIFIEHFSVTRSFFFSFYRYSQSRTCILHF